MKDSDKICLNQKWKEGKGVKRIQLPDKQLVAMRATKFKYKYNQQYHHVRQVNQQKITTADAF